VNSRHIDDENAGIAMQPSVTPTFVAVGRVLVQRAQRATLIVVKKMIAATTLT